MQTDFYGITIEYNEHTADWTVIDWGQADDMPKTTEEKAEYTLEFHDDICSHVDALCRKHARDQSHTDIAVRAQDMADYRRGV